MNQVLEWSKANIFIIVFGVVIIASIVALPLMSSRMNAAVRQDVQQRAARLNDLQQIERTQIRMPGDAESRQGVVNRQLLERYQETVETARRDAEQVFEAAEEHNRKGRTVLMADMFPAPPRGMREILPRRFHERLVVAYDELLAEIGAGGPPSPDSMRDEILLRRDQFIGQILAREAGDRLTAEEEQRLREQLAELRLLKYQDSAERLRFYMSRDVLRIPSWSQQNIPNLAELFERQWRYWIHSDVLRAIAAANRDEPSLLTAPVKRVVRFDFIGAPAAGTSGRQAGAAGVGEGGAMVGGGGAMVGAAGVPGVPGTAGDDPDERPGEPQIDARAEVRLDFATSFTGRTANALYDVRHVELELIVETARIPELLDALASHNFMTVVGLRISQVDPYEDARDGYFYGMEPVSRVVLQVETIWLRTWTAQYMPATTRQALGIRSAAATPDY